MKTLSDKPITEYRMAGRIGLFVLLLAGIKWSMGLAQHMDVLFGDEAEYIRNGLDLFRIIRNDWGPAYNIWYKFLSFFFHDTLQLYYANYMIGGIAVSVLLYVMLNSFKLNPYVSLYISFCFFVSSININTWPRISHFVLLLVLSTLIALSRLRKPAAKALLLSILCYVCSYARPDLFMAFLLMISLGVYLLYKDRSAFRSVLPLLFILLIAVLFFQFVFGFPSPTYKGGLNRLYSAFCQHYAMNYKYRTHASFDAVTEWIDFCKNKFPDCSTIGDVIRKHPQDFFQNLVFNLKNYLLLLLNTLCSFVFPTGIFGGKKAFLAAAVLLFGLLSVVLIPEENRKKYIALLHKHALILFFLLAFGLPSIGMCCIIFPRPHYILLHSLLFLFPLALAGQVALDALPPKPLYFMALGLVLLFIAPSSDHYRYMQFGSDMDHLCEQKLIRFLESKKDKDYVVFTNYLNITYILPENYSEFSTEFELKRGMSFSDILCKRKINMILVSSNILQNPILVKDTLWTKLIAQPEQYQFKKVRYSGECESYLLIKE